jgi:protein involved in polysaccharide export with SLBB domain
MGLKPTVWGKRASATVLLALATSFAHAQQQQQNRQGDRSTPEPVYTQRPRTPEPSELAQENYSRVAASAADIRAVLTRDPGLMVELKRWVAKEATDNGQIVEDADLTDRAISERLEHDVAFRSIATRLLQRYGYLMPTPNPESDIAKEKDLVLKERARTLVNLENQEDAASTQPKEKNADMERSEECDPRVDDQCQDRTSRYRRSQRRVSPDNVAPPGQNQTAPPDTTFPPMLDVPSQSRTLQAAGGMGYGEGGFDSQGGEFGLMASALRSRSDLTGGMTPGAAGGLGDLSMLARGLDPFSMGNFGGGSQPDSTTRTPLRPRDMRRYDRYDREGRDDRYDRNGKERSDELDDVNPVKMVRPANPYADVPSLYDMYVQAAAWQRPVEAFGLEVFRNSDNEPDVIPMDLPVGPDYVVGPGDSLSIDLWGGISQRMVRTVDRQGRVSLPEAGPLLVAGKTLGDVQTAVQRVLRTEYRDVSADVSISRLRTVRVYVVGEVADPGAYDISSLSTPLNAIFAAGGITGRGSMRTLKHYRGKELVQEVDAYDLLLHGIRTDVKQLQSGDTLLVPPVGPQVTIDGMVRRPAIYEIKNEASLADALELAGGILPTAALRHVEVQRLEAHEKRTMFSLEISSAEGNPGITRQLAAFKVQGGDQIHIFPMASFNEQSIYLQGHVQRPGKYSFKPGMRVTDVIATYSDLLPEPAAHYGEIVRLNAPDFHPSVESFDVAAALATPASAPKLQPLDTVRIFSRYAFEPPPDVWVGGEVNVPGKYRTSGQAHLLDAVYLAGGMTRDASLDSAQLFRTQADGTMKIMSIDLRKAVGGDPAQNIALQPRDRILIHRNAAQVEPATVYVKGEVAKPGRYPLAANMRVQDLVRVAGGLKRSADSDTADLTRFAAANSTGTNDRLEVKLAAALGGDGNEDVPLRDGDVLTVRQVPQWNDLGSTVRVRGEVQHPATYGIEPGEKLSSLLKRTGGFTSEAYPYGAVLLRREVRDAQMQAHDDLVRRVKAEQDYLRVLPEGDADQKHAKMQAIAQAQTALQQLETTPPVGRVVVHVPPDVKDFASFEKSAANLDLRDGDELIVPKKANYVMVNGQVYNPTAVGYLPGKSAKWYLSQAGGLTAIADKDGAFVIRADGSVLAAKNNSGIWSGDPLNTVLRAGDSIVVPEKAPKVAPRNWGTIFQAAQVASSVALAVAYIHP